MIKKGKVCGKTQMRIATVVAMSGLFMQDVVADTTITFFDNVNPLSSFPGTLIHPGLNTTVTTSMPTSAEFRMLDPTLGQAGGGGVKSVIGSATATGGPTATPDSHNKESWIFNNAGTFISVENTADTPGTQTGADPSGNTGLHQNAFFLLADFGFMAPFQGQPVATTYGVGSMQRNGSDVSITYPVLEAQWGSTYFPLGLANNKGVTFRGTISSSDNHTVVLTAEHKIVASEDPGGAGFANWVAQWELHGAINGDPQVTDKSYSTAPGTPVAISASDLAADPESDTLSIKSGSLVDSGADNGTITCSSSDCTYTPTGLGIDSFTVIVEDNASSNHTAISSNGSVTRTVQVEVTAAAVCLNDTASLNQDSQNNSINIASNDTDVDGTIDGSTITITQQPSNGSLGNPLPGDGTVIYTPTTGFNGTDSFTYTIADNNGNVCSTPATVAITVKSTTPSTLTGPVNPALTSSVLATASSLVSAGIPADDRFQVNCDPDCFDFVAATDNSGNAVVVFPLSGAIPASSTLRKYMNGEWVDFNTSQGDTFKSAAGSLGSCPPAGDSSYVAFTEGHFCLQLTIADGGPNDSDSVTNQVTDPSGLHNTDPEPVPWQGQQISGGCSVTAAQAGQPQRGDWFLIGLLLGFIGLVQLRKSACP